MSDLADDLAALTFEEIVRLVNELAQRLDGGSPLAALSTIQALVGRAAELGEYCGTQLHAGLAGPAGAEDVPGYL